MQKLCSRPLTDITSLEKDLEMDMLLYTRDDLEDTMQIWSEPGGGRSGEDKEGLGIGDLSVFTFRLRGFACYFPVKWGRSGVSIDQAKENFTDTTCSKLLLLLLCDKTNKDISMVVTRAGRGVKLNLTMS